MSSPTTPVGCLVRRAPRERIRRRICRDQLLIFAELSIGFDSIEDLDLALPDNIEREDLPWEAAFLAGRCFLQYRHSGGARRSRLPDFYIAAHAATRGRTLLTRDRPRYLHLLPGLDVISPD